MTGHRLVKASSYVVLAVLLLATSVGLRAAIVDPTPTFISMGASVSPSVIVQPVTFTARVTGTTPPLGTVSFSIDGVPVASVALSVFGGASFASFTTNTMPVGSHTVIATYLGNDIHAPSSTPPRFHVVAAVPPFSQVLTPPSGACICTPIVRNAFTGSTENWFVLASGPSLTVTVVARSVSASGGETVRAMIRDANGFHVGGPIDASFPSGTPFGQEVSSSGTVSVTAGERYRVEITTPSTAPNQGVYRLTFDGAAEASMPSPSFQHIEGGAQTRWLFNVEPTEPLGVRLFTSPASGDRATNATVQVFDMSAPHTPVSLRNPADGQPVPTVTLNNPLGIDTVMSFADGFVSPRAIYALEIQQIDGHHRLSRLSAVPVLDSAIYVGWNSFGSGSVTTTVNAGPLTLSSISADVTRLGTNIPVPVGTRTFNNIPSGPYQASFSAPPGFTVTPAQASFNVTCGANTPVVVSVRAATSTTVASSVNPSAFGQPATFTAAVTSPGGIPTGTVTFREGATVLAIVPVNASGHAVHVTSALSVGAHTITAEYDGNPYFLRSGPASTNQLVFAYPSGAGGGTFVIGNGSATLGSPVTFWGAQWSKVNTLSGGAAPDSFKGFAVRTTPAPPQAGGTWTTSTGNSADPPATLPEYIAVIVSSAVTQSGAAIAGDIRSVVVVRVNPGYGVGAGHVGTGAVVAVIQP